MFVLWVYYCGVILSSSPILDPSVFLVDLPFSLFTSLETGGVRFEGLWRCRRWGHGLTVDTEAFERAVVEISKLGGSGGGQLNVPPGWCRSLWKLNPWSKLWMMNVNVQVITGRKLDLQYRGKDWNLLQHTSIKSIRVTYSRISSYFTKRSINDFYTVVFGVKSQYKKKNRGMWLSDCRSYRERVKKVFSSHLSFSRTSLMKDGGGIFSLTTH
ncbi:hypothetical protein HID58_017988 [Brassica napus]|uniref:Uncharacterized protein n=1 Tax=Brassica napus TaxID=3708 RepID=A0ABQ8D9U4_BRANA|nr:hypothetical protein HID58_017988 [Brassica napus]